MTLSDPSMKTSVNSPQLEYDLRQAIRTIPDYPKPGIMFRDITTLLGDARAFRRAVDALVQPWAGSKVDKVAGIEARGFILGGAVAHQLSAGFVPIRKKGKLPHETVRIAYSLEYGIDEMEMHADAIGQEERVLLIDDLIATGGTAVAAVRLLRQIARIYGGRPGLLGFLRLARAAFSHLAVTGGVAVGDSLVQQVLGLGLAARISAKLGEGVLNGLMTARFGLAALAVCRPLPFVREEPPKLGDVAGELLSRIEAVDRPGA